MHWFNFLTTTKRLWELGRFVASFPFIEDCGLLTLFEDKGAYFKVDINSKLF